MLYGSGALGGVISYDTVDASDLLDAGKTAAIAYLLPARRAITASGWAPAPMAAPNPWTAWFMVQPRSRRHRQSDGARAPNDESINNMLAKGSWKIDPAQTLSGSLRYYNNDAQEPKNPQTTDASSSNPMTNRPPFSAMPSLATALRQPETTG
ncbi:hypothetical protein ACVXG7_17780 [Enterobacter hormaechei]